MQNRSTEQLEELWKQINSLDTEGAEIYSLGGKLVKIGLDKNNRLIWVFLSIKFLDTLAEITFNVDRQGIKELKDHIFTQKQIFKKPRIIRSMYLFDDRGEEVKWGETRTFDGEDFHIKQALPKINEDSDIELVDKLLRTCMPNEQTYNLAVKFLAQIFFEERKRAKPTLILWGGRGTGKTLFVKAFLKPFLPNNLGQVDRDATSKFNTYRENRVIWGEELDKSSMDLHRLCKEISGNELVRLERKRVDAIDIDMISWVVLTANQLPVAITEKISDDRNNQYIIGKCTVDMQHREFYEELEDTGRDFASIAEDGMGKWLRDIVLPIYKKEMFRKPQREVGRYGFRIPLTASHQLAQTLGTNPVGDAVLDIFSRLRNYNIDSPALDNHPDSNIREVLMNFHKTGALPALLLDLPNIPKMKKSAFKHGIANIEALSSNVPQKNVRINGKIYYCSMYKVEEIQEVLGEDPSEDSFVDDLFGDDSIPDFTFDGGEA